MNELHPGMISTSDAADGTPSVWSAASNPWWEAMLADERADSESVPVPPRGFWRRLIVWFTEYNRY